MLFNFASNKGTTQDNLSIEDIKDDLVVLKSGSMALILQTSAVNFGLLSEKEQLAIILNFASLLNSLSFPIQILIRSKRLDVSSYLQSIKVAESKQTNPLLFKMMGKYRMFIEQTVREKDVLDKQFYIVIQVSYLELGILKNVEGHFQKAITILIPRRDHILRQLQRVGIKANQLQTKELIQLFYDIYNPPYKALAVESIKQPVVSQQQTQQKAQKTATPQPLITPAQNILTPQAKPQVETITIPQQPIVRDLPPNLSTPTTAQTLPPPSSVKLTSSTPFVVEELSDDYGTA